MAALDADPATLGPADHRVVADTTGTEYCLGPTELTGGALEDAFIVDDGRVSSLDLRFSPDGIVAFNLSASRCYDAEPSCPSSRMAIVVGDKVFATPSINSPSFDRDQIRLSGADDPTRLSDLADLVHSSPDTIQFRPVIVEVPLGMSLASIADMLENEG